MEEQTEKQTDRQTDRHLHRYLLIAPHSINNALFILHIYHFYLSHVTFTHWRTLSNCIALCPLFYTLFYFFIFLCSSVHMCFLKCDQTYYMFLGGKKTPLNSATLTGGGDEFQIQAEKDSSTSNKGKVIKR